jgi:hypothetical protein
MTSAMAGDKACLVDDAVVAACDDVVAAELELLRPYARTAQSLVATDNKRNRQKYENDEIEVLLPLIIIFKNEKDKNREKKHSGEGRAQGLRKDERLLQKKRD